MRHDVIRPIEHEADDNRPSPYHESARPADLNALKKGAIVGLWVAGILVAREYGPSVFDWLAS